MSTAPEKGVETEKFVYYDFNSIITITYMYISKKGVCLLFNNKQNFESNRRHTAKSISNDQECRWYTWDTQAQRRGLQHVSVMVCNAQTSLWVELLKSKH